MFHVVLLALVPVCHLHDKSMPQVAMDPRMRHMHMNPTCSLELSLPEPRKPTGSSN